VTTVSAHPQQPLTAEARLARHIIRSLLVTVPLMVALWVGLVALAVSFTTSRYAGPIAMAAAVGVLAGIFWGTWLGFVLDSLDEEHARAATRAGNHA
jgi:hypothetical protein